MRNEMKTIIRHMLALSLISIIFAGIMSCSETENAKEINFSIAEDVKVTSQQSKGKTVRIAVGGMITPREGFTYYKKLLNYIEEKLGKKIEFVDREDYEEINKLLEKGAIDVAFVCGGPYVDGHKEFGMELLAAPHAYGGTVYYSYIIAHRDSPIDNFEELRGKTFGFTDPLSNTGKLVPTYMLAKMDETPDSFFKSYDYTYAHDKSIKAVATGLVDGAAVDSLIWEYANRANPEYTSKTKIIKKSPPYGIPPVVIRSGLDPNFKESLRKIFLNVHNDKEGKEILQGMMIEKFVLLKDSAYDSIREMKQWIADQKRENK
jgi:phosphonate transport system substrate-binding protein